MAEAAAAGTDPSPEEGSDLSTYRVLSPEGQVEGFAAHQGLKSRPLCFM